MEQKLQESMGLLRSFKDQHDEVERQKLESEKNLLQVREELIESQRIQESILGEHSEEQQSYRQNMDRLRSNSEMREQELACKIKTLEQ